MARPREFEEQVVLQRAMELFWERGYEATSVSDLTVRLGLGKASLYNAFGSKHQLYLRAVEHYVRGRDKVIVEILARPGSPLDAVRSVISRYAKEIEESGALGCLVVTAAVERMPKDEEVARWVQASWQTLRVALTSALLRARAQGEVAADVDPHAVARFLLVMLQGMRVIGKGRDTGADVRAAAQQAMFFLERLEQN